MLKIIVICYFVDGRFIEWILIFVMEDLLLWKSD